MKQENVDLYSLVVISITELQQGLMDCVAEDLRFEVGDMIYANVGHYAKGKIIKCWDRGNPYRVEIQDENKTNVWVPIDSDQFVMSDI